MIFYILMGIIFIVCNIWGINAAKKRWGDWYDWLVGCLIGIGISAIVFLVGFLIQTEITTEYDEPQLVAEARLVSLSNDLGVDGSGRRYYVSLDSENVYSYRVEIPNSKYAEASETTYKVRTVSNALEVETNDGSPARLVKYEEKGHVSFLSMGLSREVYVFYVPEGTIAKTIALE